MSGTADVTDPVAWTSQLSAMLSSGRAVSDMSDAETLVTRHVGGELAEMDIYILHSPFMLFSLPPCLNIMLSHLCLDLGVIA